MAVVETSRADQRLAALQRANAVRTEQAKFTAGISALNSVDGAHRVAAAIISGEADSIPIGRLLRAIRFVGHSKTHRVLVAAGIRSDVRPVGDLSERQRAQLAALLRSRAWS